MSAANYDVRQHDAILVRCLRCRLWWWMTVPTFVCIACRRDEEDAR
jgi:hypothetical protein